MEYTIIQISVLVFYLLFALVVAAITMVPIRGIFLGEGPFVSTPWTVMDKMMELADIKKGEKVYDLGCGDGRLLIEANKRYGAKAVGIEISPFVYWLAKIATRFSQAKVKVIRGNIFEFDFSDADVVFCYLFPEPMKKLEKKFKNLKKGCRIISHGFEIPGWKPLMHIKVKRDNKKKIQTIFKYQV